MAKFDPIAQHKNIGYYAVVRGHNQLNGVTVEIPRNLFLDKPKQDITYYVEDSGTRDSLSIYINGEKSKTYKFSKKITKLIIGVDILQRIQEVGISEDILFGENEDGEEFPEEYDIFDIIFSIMNKTATEEEKVLVHHVRELLNENSSDVPEELIEHYSRILCHDFME